MMEQITDFYSFLLSVISISLSGVMAPGPVLAVTIAKGSKNKKAGFLISLGHGAVEFPLMSFIYFGFAEFLSSNVVQKIIGLAGGLILIYTGVRTLKTQSEDSTRPSAFKHGSIVSGILTTVANPYFLLWWATIGTSLTVNASVFGFFGFLIFAIAHWSCDLLWNTFVSFTVFKSRRFWTRKVQRAVFALCSAILASFGVFFIVSAIR
jgi:threonine/homoserine/homoserine lactone efflux protein